MTAWIAQLNMRHFFMLRDLSHALKMAPDKLALHLLEREHGRVFGAEADDDEVTLPNNCPPEPGGISNMPHWPMRKCYKRTRG